jgi:hypothetical protein
MPNVETRIHMFLGNAERRSCLITFGRSTQQTRTKTPGLVQTLGGEKES